MNKIHEKKIQKSKESAPPDFNKNEEREAT